MEWILEKLAVSQLVKKFHTFYGSYFYPLLNISEQGFSTEGSC